MCTFTYFTVILSLSLHSMHTFRCTVKRCKTLPVAKL
jgi:hypothetical protein